MRFYNRKTYEYRRKVLESAVYDTRRNYTELCERVLRLSLFGKEEDKERLTALKQERDTAYHYYVKAVCECAIFVHEGAIA